MRALILIEETTIKNAQDEKAPTLSHDLNLLAFANTALAFGYEIHIQQKGDYFYEAKQLFELTAVDGRISHLSEISKFASDYDLIVSCFLDALTGAKNMFPKAKIICMVPALYFIENPSIWRNDHWINSANALRNDIDFITFQNVRMRDIAFPFYHVLSRWERKDRMLISPLGPSELKSCTADERKNARRQLGFNDKDMVLINAGGVYKWTDFAIFLKAFLLFVEDGNINLKLILPSLKQKQNSDHGEFVSHIYEIISEHKETFKTHVYYEPDWDVASANMERYLIASDVGLNVSKDSLENWQSHRVRCIDYFSHGMPFIATEGDLHSKFSDRNGIFVVIPGDINSYFMAFNEIQADTNLRKARSQIKEYAEAFVQHKVYGNLLQTINAVENEPRDRYVAGQHIFSMSDTHSAIIPPVATILKRSVKISLNKLLKISRFMRRVPLLNNIDRWIRDTKVLKAILRRYF